MYGRGDQGLLYRSVLELGSSMDLQLSWMCFRRNCTVDFPLG